MAPPLDVVGFFSELRTSLEGIMDGSENEISVTMAVKTVGMHVFDSCLFHPSIHQNLHDLFMRTHDLHFRKATYVCLVEISKLGFHMASFSKGRPWE